MRIHNLNQHLLTVKPLAWLVVGVLVGIVVGVLVRIVVGQGHHAELLLIGGGGNYKANMA